MSRNMLSLLESLETGLVDTHITSQRDAFKELIEGLKRLTVAAIQDVEVEYLVDFFIARLSIADPGVIGHLLDGFLWLAQSARSTDPHNAPLLTGTQAARICRDGLFAKLAVTSLAKRSRVQVFQLLQSLLTGPQLEGLKSMHKEFLMGYMQTIDGERDPENLLMIFNMNLIVIEHFPIDEVKDDFFEIMSVYFPVDFSPPAGGGTSGVTREALATQLHRCLFASRLFAANQLLPLLCEKADADWTQGRIDSLSLLADCLHGELVTVPGSKSFTASPGLSIPLNHVSSYLVLIGPLLAKITNLQTKSRKLNSLVTSCMTGLVHCYTTQTDDAHRLSDFVAVTCRTLGLQTDLTNESQALSAELPSEQLINVLSQTIKYSAGNTRLTLIFLTYLLPYFGASLLCSSLSDDPIVEKLNSLLPWSQFYRVACRLMDAALGNSYLPNLQEKVDCSNAQPLEFLKTLYARSESLLDQIHDEILSKSNLEATKLSLSLIELICFCPFGLVLRMQLLGLVSSVDRKTPSAMASLVCQLVHYVNSYPGVTELQATVRSELVRLVSLLYHDSSNVETLSTSLFAQIQEFQSDSLELNLAMDILETVASSNLSVFNFLVQYLCNRVQQTMEQFITSPAVRRLVSMLNSVSRSFIVSPTDQSIVQGLYTTLIGKAALFLSLLLPPAEKSLTPLKQLENVFRLTTCLASEDQQNALLLAYDLTETETLQSVPLRIICWCSIISGLKPELVQSVVRVRSFQWLTNLCQLMRTSLDPATSEQNRNHLCVVVAQAFASVLNKTAEPLDSAMTVALNAVVRCLSEGPTDEPLRILQPWLGFYTLRALVAHPGPSRWSHAQQLVSSLVPIEKKGNMALQKHAGDEFERFIPTLIESPHPGDVFSEICHWHGTCLLVQKTFCLLGKRLKERILQLTEFTRLSDQVPPETRLLLDSSLAAWLKLCSNLPPELVLQESKDAIRFTLQAVTSSELTVAQTSGLHLLCILSELAGSAGSELWESLSPGDADALFSALPRVVQNSYDVCTGAKLVTSKDHDDTHCLQRIRLNAEARISVARCLYYLHKLPSELVSRHRDVEVMPLLAKLIDDPNRAVRLAAVRTQNAWLL